MKSRIQCGEHFADGSNFCGRKLLYYFMCIYIYCIICACIGVCELYFINTNFHCG